MTPILFFALAIVSVWASINLYHPVKNYKHGAAISFASGLVTGELAFHHITMQAIIVAAFILSGKVHGLLGTTGLLLFVCSWLIMGLFYFQANLTRAQIAKGLREGLGTSYKNQINPEFRRFFNPTINYQRILLPHTGLRPSHVEVIRNISYHQVNGLNLKLDIRRLRSTGHGNALNKMPVLFQIHGGAWTHRMGSKNEQALPLMNYLCERGWICVSISYRLSPLATFPDHIIDCKRALKWTKENIARYGGNPDFIIATGGSAGGHLSALLSLTPNLPMFQPEFEDFDSSVQGCVSFYGIYDFMDSGKLQTHSGLHELLEKSVLKASKQNNPELYQLASPIQHIHDEAPPFMLIQGDKDTLVAVSETRLFAEKLCQASNQAVVYVELPGAQHAFDLLPSLRTELTLRGVEQFVFWVLSQYQIRLK